MFWTVTQSLLEGFSKTVEIFVVTLAFAIPLGLIISFGSMSKIAPVKWLCKTFVWIIRGTPLMLQLIAVFYGPGLMLSWITKMSLDLPAAVMGVINALAAMDRITAVFIAFIVNYSCYFSEIYRGGIEAIPKGQYEACQVLGMTKSQTFFKVVLLQVIKRIVPPMGNEIITLVKDTSLARIIAVYEIIYNAEKFIKLEGIIWPLFYTGAFYLIFCGVLTVLFGRIEKKMDYFRG
ncbi:MAG: amino acid ABC transporter permease [Clostridia bacterium]|nr:amino acid ABC transporter permease [Clostridia bacterium]MBR3588888.1 amino acid ABC transporter permease [Clostridia bacterium]MBR3975561.1 amino acid ABC transporter permease [Clostridia bacterium]